MKDEAGLLLESSWRRREWASDKVGWEMRRWRMRHEDWRVGDMPWSVEDVKRERALDGGIFTIFCISMMLP